MKITNNQHVFSRAVCLFILVCICFGASGKARAADSAWDKFVPPPDNKFDWIQLTNGEWLKGEFTNSKFFMTMKLSSIVMSWICKPLTWKM
jgi:hypothetical protein